MRVKNFAAQLALARQRNEVIGKKLGERQASSLLVAVRQKILNLSPTYARRLVGLKDVREVKQVLDEAAISILNEIKGLPRAVTDPSRRAILKIRSNAYPADSGFVIFFRER